MARFRPGRDLPPFLLGVACTLLFTSLRLSVSKVEDLNGVDRASNAVQWSEKGGKTAIAAASPPPARTRVQVVIGVQVRTSYASYSESDRLAQAKETISPVVLASLCNKSLQPGNVTFTSVRSCSKLCSKQLTQSH